MLSSHSRANSSASSMRSIASTPLVLDNDAVIEQDRTMDSDVKDMGLTSKNLLGPRYRPLKQKRSSKTNQQGASKGVMDRLRMNKCHNSGKNYSNGESCVIIMPKGRIGSICGNIRKAVQAHVASHYQLMKGADKRVAELLKNNAYIYPVNTKVRTMLIFAIIGVDSALQGDLIQTKPFQVPAVLDTIKDTFFSGELADHPDEVELPVAMVALASATVCSVIMQYSSEKYDRNFNSEMYDGIYQTLVGMLNRHFSGHGSKCKTDEPGTAESLMFLDIEGMADE
ncbi:hypothetical protein DFH29DRAFT_1016389 [Suillus ampliporus]|nr:hypothetical protein DFH29DRAFT_1016389 [Suillus ampliporus]